jgi:hypothetical protein
VARPSPSLRQPTKYVATLFHYALRDFHLLSDDLIQFLQGESIVGGDHFHLVPSMPKSTTTSSGMTNPESVMRAAVIEASAQL